MELEEKIEEEKRYFESIRKKVMEEHSGMYIAICNKKIAGIGKTMDDAFRQAWEKYKVVPMYIGKAVPREYDYEEMFSVPYVH